MIGNQVGSTWKLATSSQSPPTIIPYVSRENVSCGGVFNTTANPMSNATALSYANENITYCYADVARERKEYDNVTFFNDFTPNITAGLAARIATLSTDRLRYHHNWINIFRILGLRWRVLSAKYVFVYVFE